MKGKFRRKVVYRRKFCVLKEDRKKGGNKEVETKIQADASSN